MGQHLSLDVEIRQGAFGLAVRHELPLDGITALFGPSGSGKTTLLRTLAGLERSAKGRIAFDGETWVDSRQGTFVEPHRRETGYVFQDARLFPHLSVEGNLRYADRRSSAGAGHITFGDVVGALDLEPLLSRRCATLSGGEAQRVAIARATLTRPRLMLMDEPLSALDYRRKAAILPYIERLPERFGMPVLYVTHAIDEAARLARRMMVLQDGRMLAEGPIGEVMERLDLQPATGHFEAGVLLETTVLRHDPRFRLTVLACCGQEIAMPEADLPVGAPARVRVRARDVALALSKPSGITIRNVLAGRIARIAEEADTAFAETLVDIGGVNLRARITRASVAELGLKEGDRVHALVKSIAFDRRAI